MRSNRRNTSISICSPGSARLVVAVGHLFWSTEPTSGSGNLVAAICMTWYRSSCRRSMLRIPDAPDELFKIPYEAAESDAIRYALIYHNGGVYLDTDFLAVDMTPIIDRKHPQQQGQTRSVTAQNACRLSKDPGPRYCHIHC